MRNLPRPRKRFGQNFLQDASVLEAIVRAINPQKGERIIEIGPGRGALTRELLSCTPSIEAIELDRDLCAYLKTVFKPEQLHIFEQDVLTFDFAAHAALNQDQPRLRLVGNLPYNLSSALLLKWVETPQCIQDIHIMLQKEVIERLAASPSTPAYSKLSIAVQTVFEVEPLFEVPPESFFPVPAVDSMVARLLPHRPADQQRFACNRSVLEAVLQMAFGQRRKMLSNSLKALPVALDWDSWGIDPQRRPESVEVEDWVKLARQLEPLWPHLLQTTALRTAADG